MITKDTSPIEKLRKLLPPLDKLQHFFCGAFLPLMAIVMPWYLMLALTALIGVGVEVFQYYTKTGAFSLLDAWYVMLPAIITSAILILQ